MEQRIYGKIKLFKRKREGEKAGFGYGFITRDDNGEDIFFHVSGLDEGFTEDQIEVDLPVAFSVIKSSKGIKAVQINFAV